MAEQNDPAMAELMELLESEPAKAAAPGPDYSSPM